MTSSEILAQLEKLGSPQTVKSYRNHGATCEMFGCKGVVDEKVSGTVLEQ